jgi:glyoxylase-like metal-dependent hydrolase (beta-lactamase superfamily II)
MDADPWEPVGTGVHRRRYQPLDISVTVIETADGLALVDTRRDPHEADEVIADVAARFGRPIRWVINTHAHHDHSFGNQRFGPDSPAPATIYGHANLVKHYREYEEVRLAAMAAGTLERPTYDWRSVVLTPPDQLVAERTTVDLGGRPVDLIPLGPAHTDGDLVVHLPDAGVWMMGDVIEQTYPIGYGTGCDPLRWADTLDGLLAEVPPGDVLVPGHGHVVDRAYAAHQSTEIRWIAERIRDAHRRGLDVDTAVAERTDWPVPERTARRALIRGLELLGPAS